MDCGISAGELDGLQEGLEMQEKAELQEKMLIQKRLKLQELRPEVLIASEFGLSAGELERLLLQRLLYRREEKLARLQERRDIGVGGCRSKGTGWRDCRSCGAGVFGFWWPGGWRWWGGRCGVSCCRG